MPRILLLHASVGSGHTSAAEALGEAFRRKQDGEVRVDDVFEYGSQLFREAYTGFYLRLSDKAPFLWKLFYETYETDNLEWASVRSQLQGMVERPLVSKLERFVERFAPDAIICTHPLPIEVLLRLKLEGHLKPPIYSVVTDFVAHSVWLTPGVDGFFLASDLTRDELIARGMPPGILRVCGIPVRLEIAEPKQPEQMRDRHHLPRGVPVITLFGGGLVPERVRLMVSRLLSIERPGMLVVVAGRNEHLISALGDLSPGPQMDLRLLGRITYVDDLVAASDLVITKSGGLITSEVLARGTPMVVVAPIPGQEEWNADFVVSSGAGIQLRMTETAPAAVLRLLDQPERLEMMRRQAALVGRPRAALDIAEQVLYDLRVAYLK